jgi:hypothetical protein
LGTAREDFLRRYATSPTHVPRLERLLAAYGDDEESEAFAVRFLGWDRACRGAEAARIVAEIMCVCVDDSGRVRRLEDGVVLGAIGWLADSKTSTLAVRAKRLQDVLTSGKPDQIRWLIETLKP